MPADAPTMPTPRPPHESRPARLVRTARTRLADLVTFVTRLGVRSADPEVRRRQGFVNIAAMIAGANSFQHLIEQALNNYPVLKPLVFHNLLFGIAHFATPLFHRISPNAAAMWLCSVIIIGTIGVIRHTGLEGGAHVYFAFTAGAFLFFGVQNWRHYVVVVAAAFATVVGAMALAPERGPIALADPEFTEKLEHMVLLNVIVINVLLFTYALVQLHRAEEQVAAERDRADRLLLAILPPGIADTLKDRPNEIVADSHATVTIFFADVVGFTSAARTASPEKLVNWLDILFKSVDELAAHHRVEKIKTIGDAYMAVSGLSGPADEGAADMARFALAFRAFARAYNGIHGEPLRVRVGLHTGPVVAGVIGGTRFAYDLWGDAVNTASRMESHGEADRIQVSAATAVLLAGEFVVERRGTVDVKGLGLVETFWLEAEGRAAAAPSRRRQRPKPTLQA